MVWATISASPSALCTGSATVTVCNYSGKGTRRIAHNALANHIRIDDIRPVEARHDALAILLGKVDCGGNAAQHVPVSWQVSAVAVAVGQGTYDQNRRRFL